jgi:cell division protease FtsH
MSENLGPVALGRQNGNVFLGRDIASDRDYSDATAASIDKEVTELVDQAYQRAKKVLEDNRPILDQLAQMLIEKETVDSEELQEILQNNEVTMAALA